VLLLTQKSQKIKQKKNSLALREKKKTGQTTNALPLPGLDGKKGKKKETLVGPAALSVPPKKRIQKPTMDGNRMKKEEKG
jgi:hypothetical protein